MESSTTNIYLQRINLVIDYICTNLDQDLSLGTLAHVAAFSPFHFHRVFLSIVGETLNDFVSRVRIERAALLMRASPRLPALEAALSCGYNSPAGFSRAFKKRFGMSPRQWDRQSPLRDRAIGEADGEFPTYTLNALRALAVEREYDVRIESLPAQQLAYVRVPDSYASFKRIVEAYHLLTGWYQACGGDADHLCLYGMSMDDPYITPRKQCRFDWCIAVPEDWIGEGAISMRAQPACEVAAIHVQGDLHVFDAAWQYLWNYWLPRSAFQPAHLPTMEIYRRLPSELGWEQYDIDCAIPVRLLH